MSYPKLYLAVPPRRFNLVSGIVLICAGVLLNQWTLGYFLAQDGRVDALHTRIIIWVIEAVLLLAGVFPFASRELRKCIVFIPMLTGLSLIGLEIALQVLNLFIPIDPPSVALNRRLLLSPYRKEAWAKQLMEEHDRAEQDYHPYLGWDRGEFRGKYVNVDARGVRKTWNPPARALDGTKVKTLYVFGGSTTWGTGARDEYTIPSFISKKLHGKGHLFRVSNYGEGGYSFTQELIHLALLLRESHRPDFVIFYDGINDIYAAFLHGRPGATFYESRIREKIKKKEPTDFEHLRLALAGISQNHCMIYKTFRKVFGLLATKRDIREEPDHSSEIKEEELQSLSEGIADYYVTSYRFLERLSREFEFQYLCFWQPVIFTEKTLTGEERKMAGPKFQEIPRAQVHRHVIRILNERSLPFFFDIADVLAGREETYYVDDWHLSERGNEVVAERIVQIFEGEFLNAGLTD